MKIKLNWIEFNEIDNFRLGIESQKINENVTLALSDNLFTY